jgi:hypothetical protein
VAFLRSVAETDYEVGGPLEVVGRLLHRLAGDARDPLLGAHAERGQHRHVPRVEEELAQDRAPEIAVGLLDQQEVAEIPRVAEEGEVVRAPPPALHLAREAEPHLRLPDEVERDVGQRDVLLEDGRMAAPLADPVAEDQRVVPHPQEELEERVVPHHMCPASSGMSKKLGCR